MLRFYRTIHHNQLGRVCKRLPGTLYRRQLSSVVPPNENANGKKDGADLTLLYQRDEERNALPRTSFLVSSLNSMYWVWYVADFVPAVNASAVENFHIDPIYGYGGLGLSLLIQTAFTLYPLSLVSKIANRKVSNSDSGDGKKASASPQEILVWKHTLPLLRTSSKPLVFPVGSISLDRTSENTRIILEDLGGNIANFEGFLGLKKVGETKQSSLASYFPLLVDIRKPSEVCDSEAMVQVLLSGGNNRHNQKGSQKKQRSAEDSDKKFHQKKFQKKKRHRGKKY